ncbi:MAG: hypothetical protein AMXMBFR42_24030 [Burkholderiales bacterium]
MSPPRAELVAAVRRNCAISDARHAREMTMCTYLLAMREHFRWERGMAQGAPLARDEVGAWLTAREAEWETLAGEDYRPLPVGGELVDPWDADAVNRTLLPEGLVYGAGIGGFGKPQFFVAALERNERRHGSRVLVAGREHARDLDAAPAATRGDTIYVRRESLARVLWDMAEAWGVRRNDGALRSALDAHGFEAGSAAALQRMVDAETETLILHELGEREAATWLGPAWERSLSEAKRRRTSIVMRAARDHLADCLVTLPELVRRDARASLHLWFAGLDGMRRELFPRALLAYRAWLDGDRGDALLDTAAAGAEHWRRACVQVVDALTAGDGERSVDDLSTSDAFRF